MNDFIKSSIVPVVYMGGTGGHFVASLLHKASLGDTDDDYRLSEYGNCHYAKLGLGSLGGFNCQLEVQINKLKLMDVSANPYETYYWPLHTEKLELVMNEFDRCVKITYSENDFDEIADAFYIKWGVEGDKMTLHSHSYRFWRKCHDSVLRHYHRFFSADSRYGNRMLNISWYELYHDQNIDDVIEKLSKFTGIDSINFSKDFITHWRERTQLGLSKVNQLKISADR